MTSRSYLNESRLHFAATYILFSETFTPHRSYSSAAFSWANALSLPPFCAPFVEEALYLNVLFGIKNTQHSINEIMYLFVMTINTAAKWTIKK